MEMIGFIGLSHLGLVSAAAAAEKGFQVIAFDPDAALIRNLERSLLPVSEPQLTELVAKQGPRLRFTSDPALLAECKLVYFSLDVPTDSSGASDLQPVKELLEKYAASLQNDCAFVILSQVPPGFTRACSTRFSPDKGKLFYQVETLIFGQAVGRALHPERFMVGSPTGTEPLPPLYSRFLASFGCPVLQMRYESAELCKIAINAMLVSSVSTTNMLSGLCEAIGADWGDIAPALRLDQRIGPHAYLSPGLGLSGGNLERDLATLRRLGDEHGADVQLITAWLSLSHYRRDWVFRILFQELLRRNPEGPVAVLGLAYKAGTHSTKNSPSLELLAHLQNHPVRYYDPLVDLPSHRQNHVKTGSAVEACQGAAGVVLMTPWEQFRGRACEKAFKGMKGDLVIDPFGIAAEASAGFRYFRLGKPLTCT